MKKSIFTFAALLLTCSAMAQITLTAVPAVVPNRLDSFTLPLSVGSLPSMAPATNGSWDLDSLTLQSDYHTSGYKSPTPAFSIANAADSITCLMSATPRIGYTAWRNIQQTASGIMIPGEELLTRQAIAIGTVTGNTLDSIVFPLQAIRYNNALPVLKLPVRMGSSWTETTARNVDFNITVAAYRLNNAPAQHRQVRRYLDSVVGWGRMRVRVPGRGTSEWIQVLQVQHSDIVLDSFFLNGAPAPDVMLAAMGLTQGQTVTYPHTYFYRAGALRPLAEAVHSGPTFSAAPAAFYMHVQNLTVPLAAHSASPPADVQLYPNPVRNGSLYIAVTGAATEGWSYALINIAGQRLATGALPLSAANRTAEIRLPVGLQAGIYYISLINADEPMSVLPVTVE